MNNLRGTLSYEGTRYLGWQKTRMGPSIEGELEKSLCTILRHPVQLQAASRTDAGVHAKGQVFNFFTPEMKLEPRTLGRMRKGVNALLPPDIQVLTLEETPLDFHPTLHAVGKEYRYEICTSTIQSPFLRLFSWHFPYLLDLEAMRFAAQTLLGTHDFSSFSNERLISNPLCTLRSIQIEDLGADRIRILVQGNRFLYKMMRNLAGSLVYVGCGKIASCAVRDILLARKRCLAGVTAPAHGLYLQRVMYESLS